MPCHASIYQLSSVAQTFLFRIVDPIDIDHRTFVGETVLLDDVTVNQPFSIMCARD